MRAQKIEVEVEATQIPMQSAPPFVGSQLSFGLSIHIWSSLGHLNPAKPPHGAPVGVVGVEVLDEEVVIWGSRNAQIPGQARPLMVGSQASFGLSVQVWPASGQVNPLVASQSELLAAQMPGQSVRGSQLGFEGLGIQV